mgnify:CR=1 FL=1
MAEQASVQAFAAAFAERHPALDVLVNNAGAWFTGRRESPDGYELTFATNVLGPHLLTELLLDRMGAAPRARVVNLISTISGSYDPTDLQYSRRPYDGYKAYGQSKQALTMLTIGLARRMCRLRGDRERCRARLCANGIQRQRDRASSRNDQVLRPADGRVAGQGRRRPVVGGHVAGA